MTYIETENGTIWDNPIPAPTHKTAGITKTEWFEAVLTPSEAIRNIKAEAKIESDLTWLSSSVDIDDNIDIVEHPLLTPFAGFTYRDALRATFKFFNAAPSLDVANQSLQMGTYLQSILGLLDSPSRVPVILQGVEL